MQDTACRLDFQGYLCYTSSIRQLKYNYKKGVKMTHSIFEKAPSKGSLRVKCPISGIWYYEAHTLKCDAEHTDTLYR